MAYQWQELSERKGWDLEHLPKRARGRMMVPILRAGGLDVRYVDVNGVGAVSR